MKNLIIIPAVAILFTGCGGKHNNPKPAPEKAILVAPAQNAVCTTGTVISDSTSSIMFSWKQAKNASNYNLVYKNLLTSATVTKSTSNTQLTVTLLRNTPYAWYVISKSAQSNATDKSDIWKFYNAGAGVTIYAPFPAEIISPGYDAAVAAQS